MFSFFKIDFCQKHPDFTITNEFASLNYLYNVCKFNDIQFIDYCKI